MNELDKKRDEKQEMIMTLVEHDFQFITLNKCIDLALIGLRQELEQLSFQDLKTRYSWLQINKEGDPEDAV
tara:strand:- start:3519 stop:3731 length:213 start_codon:yes stop_codon:yes gene_type:complete